MHRVILAVLSKCPDNAESPMCDSPLLALSKIIFCGHIDKEKEKTYLS